MENNCEVLEKQIFSLKENVQFMCSPPKIIPFYTRKEHAINCTVQQGNLNTTFLEYIAKGCLMKKSS